MYVLLEKTVFEGSMLYYSNIETGPRYIYRIDMEPGICMSPSTERERHVGLLRTAHFSVRCTFNYPAGVQTRDVDPMSGFCWPPSTTLANISAVLGYRVVFDATLSVGQRHRRRANINPGPMSQHSIQGLFH